VTEREQRHADQELAQQEHARLNQRLQALNLELQSSLREREVMLQEIHHRVKNNLQVISSLINMQIRKLEAGENRDALEECKSRVQAIALIHEKLYRAGDYARVPFAEYAKSLISSVFQANRHAAANVRLDSEIEELALAVDQAIPCGLILNELITNALKHAFPGARRGAVRVTLERENGRVVLGVGDDGVGIPPGVEPARAGSLGMRLISVLVDQLDGKLEIERGNGTAFRISFPDAPN
jgi:two-component sensor histidine kinase